MRDRGDNLGGKRERERRKQAKAETLSNQEGLGRECFFSPRRRAEFAANMFLETMEETKRISQGNTQMAFREIFKEAMKMVPKQI